jgi:peptidoglycan/LPS O-acetylase OafA/YrhL
VRFVLALAVVNYHLFITGATEGAPLLSEFGAMGCICGFLVISGYSIAHSIATKPTRFFQRRAWRILPIYYVTMALSLVPYLWTPSPNPFRFDVGEATAPEILSSLFLLQTFVTDKIPVFGPSWTLAIEWWLYVAAPLVLRARAWMLVALIAASFVIQRLLLEKGYYPVHLHRYGVPALMLLWAWMSGFLYYRVEGWSAVLLVLGGYWVVGRFPEGGNELPYLIASFAVVQAKRLPPMPRFLAKTLNYLGDLSYPLYLVHVPLMLWLGRWVQWKGTYPNFLSVSLLAAAVLYHGVDAPLRARFSPRPR